MRDAIGIVVVCLGAVLALIVCSVISAPSENEITPIANKAGFSRADVLSPESEVAIDLRAIEITDLKKEMIIAYYSPKKGNSGNPYLGCIAGLPGDIISIANGRVYSDGKEVGGFSYNPKKEKSKKKDKKSKRKKRKKKKKSKKGKKGKKEEVVEKVEVIVKVVDKTLFAPLLVPSEHIFVLNAELSEDKDSRTLGFIPMRNVKGIVSE